MLELYKEGITPHIQIHDELDISIPLGEKDNSKDIIKIMENAVDLQIPNKVDYESGPNWAGDDDQAIFAWAGADVNRFIKEPANERVLRYSRRVSKAVQEQSQIAVSRISGIRKHLSN